MLALALAAVAAAAPADAGGLHTCTATASGPGGVSFQVKGFGGTQAEGQRAARQSARLLVDQRLLAEVGQAWVGGGGTERLATWILSPSGEDFGTPGWTLRAEGCEQTALESAQGWSARWTSGSELVTRASAGDALEAARRRGCLTQYQVVLLRTLKARADGGPEVALSPLDGAWDELARCWSQPTPTPLPAPLADTDGPTRCTAIGADGAPRALGVGGSAERAAEDALRQVVLTESRRVVGEVATAMLRPDTPERAAEVAGRMARLAALTGPSDAVDRARLACAAVAPGPVAWRPTGRLERDCNPASWMERPKDTVLAAQAGAFLDATCALQTRSTMQIVGFSLRGASGVRRDELVASGLRVAGSCEAACYADATWGSAPRPVTLAGAPERSDKRKVVAELGAAMQGDALRGLQLFPTLQDPGALGRLFDGSLWAALRPELGALPAKAERWLQVDGHWILLPP